jgi:Asp-tRNA(Asn)/Glu-tRNA(Gln) amidotransferase A subunit family amidase
MGDGISLVAKHGDDATTIRAAAAFAAAFDWTSL